MTRPFAWQAPTEQPKVIAESASPKQQKKNNTPEENVSAREERTVRLGKAAKLRAKGKDPYEYTWEVSAATTALQAKHKDLPDGQVAEDARVRSVCDNFLT